MKRFAVAISSASIAATTALAAPNMQPGLWEITVSSEMSGMPMKMPARTMQHCYNPEDIKDPQRILPKPQEGKVKCDTHGYKIEGDTATWRLACTGEQGMAMNGSGTMTMQGDSYSGSSTIDMQAHGQAMKMMQKMSGKRIGNCK